MPLSRQKAQAVASTNNVAGVAASVADGDVTFDFSRTGDPLITVTVQRSSAAGNPIPTFFARLFGRTAVDVRASATAEAFNPSGTGVPVTASCVKPWILPNCDPLHPTPANTNCPSSGVFINANGSIAHAGDVSSGGVIGEPLLLKSGNPNFNTPAPSQYYPVTIPAGSALCPSCAGSGGGGAALYEKNIECCNTSPITCGSTQTIDLNLKTGDMQGPTKSGVGCLIHEDVSGKGAGTGQDTILIQDPPPFPMTGGSLNPDPSLQGQPITSSASIVTIPLYDGHNLCPGGSCGSTVMVIGFLQVFVSGVDTTNKGPINMGDVHAYILNVSGCGTTGGGGGGGGGPTGGGASPVPIRLVHT